MKEKNQTIHHKLQSNFINARLPLKCIYNLSIHKRNLYFYSITNKQDNSVLLILKVSYTQRRLIYI